MKKLLAWLLLAVATAVQADIWKPYDGNGVDANSAAPNLQAGMTTQRFNAAAWLPWENVGGDWTDKNGVRQGSAPFARVAVAPVMEIDVSALLDTEGFMLRGQKSVASVSSREAGPGKTPILEVVYQDETVRLEPIADATLSFSTTSALGKSTTLNLYDGAVVAFPKLKPGALSAKLILAATSGSKGIVEVYKLHIPRQPLPPVGTGYGAAYPNDVGIESDPRTIYHEGWDRPDNAWPKDWYAKAGTLNGPNAQWKQDGGLFLNPNYSGVWVADGSGRQVKAQCSDVMMNRGSGYIGRGLTAIHCRDVLARGVEFPTVSLSRKLGKQPDEVWGRYMAMYDMRHRQSAKCEGGKMPGFAGDTTFGGNSGMPSWGVRGWSMRGQFHPICDPNNPAYGRMSASLYAYDGNRLDDLNGGHWGAGELAAIPLGQWACFEHHIKINTPGMFDGIVELFIDGRLVYRNDKVFFRSERPPLGYGKWQLISKTYPAPQGAPTWTDARGLNFYYQGASQPNENSIEKFWGMAHWGGKTPSGDDHQMWYDDTVVATARVGCPVKTDVNAEAPTPEVPDVPEEPTPPDTPPEEQTFTKEEIALILSGAEALREANEKLKAELDSSAEVVFEKSEQLRISEATAKKLAQEIVDLQTSSQAAILDKDLEISVLKNKIQNYEEALSTIVEIARKQE